MSGTPAPTGGDHVDEIRKIQKKWNGAGTFGSLVTLKIHAERENAAEGWAGLSWRGDYD